MFINKAEWFSKKITELQNSLYRLAFSILKNDMDAQDAVQETIYKAYKNLDSLEYKNKFKPWIYKILTNTSYEIIKKKGEYVEINDNELESIQADVDTKLTLWDTVQKLPQPYRTTITLFYYEDMSIKQISKITNLKEDAIKKQLSRGRQKLKEVIEL